MSIKIIILYIIFIYLLIYFIVSNILKKITNKYSTTKIDNFSIIKTIQSILNIRNIKNINIEHIDGFLNDNYNFNNKTIYLSNSNESLSALTIAFHELGHALQDNENYSLLNLKKKTLKYFNILNIFSVFLFIIGLLTSNKIFFISLISLMILLIYQILTLPIEFNASIRAFNCIKETNVLKENELKIVKKILIISGINYLFSMLNFVFKIPLIFLKNKQIKSL